MMRQRRVFAQEEMNKFPGLLPSPPNDVRVPVLIAWNRSERLAQRP
jgi:hypothetical protein